MYSHHSSYGPSQLRHSVWPSQFCGPGTYGASVVVVDEDVVLANVVVGAAVVVGDCGLAAADATPAKARQLAKRMKGRMSG
jgi:hypothetical protein